MIPLQAAGRASYLSRPCGRRGLLAALPVAPSLAVVGCGNSEAAQRRAFMEFLQTRVLDVQGLRVPRPTPEQERSFGPYAAHWAPIPAFHDALSAQVTGPLRETARAAVPRSLAELVDRRAEFAAVREGAGRLRAALDAEVARAEAARAALPRQPDDLAALHGRAWDKLVTAPAAAFRDVFPVMDDALGATLGLAEVLERERAAGRVRLSGSTVEATDPRLRADLDRRMREMAAKTGAVNDAQRRLADLVAGR